VDPPSRPPPRGYKRNNSRRSAACVSGCRRAMPAPVILGSEPAAGTARARADPRLLLAAPEARRGRRGGTRPAPPAAPGAVAALHFVCLQVPAGGTGPPSLPVMRVSITTNDLVGGLVDCVEPPEPGRHGQNTVVIQLQVRGNLSARLRLTEFKAMPGDSDDARPRPPPDRRQTVTVRPGGGDS
jgi:hypothetical protein